jgi:hypothetical protein
VSTSPSSRILCALAVVAGCTAAEPPSLGSTADPLSAEQCDAFVSDGKVQICHRTSGAHPYTILKVAEAACAAAHVGHAGDYVAVGDPTCDGGGCLPSGAPCDDTLPCCDGLACTDGACAAAGCPVGLTECSGTCVDLVNDHDNCGDCGSVCPAGECMAGACVCPLGMTGCTGGCADLQTDPDHCGRCSIACGDEQICQAGACT